MKVGLSQQITENFDIEPFFFSVKLRTGKIVTGGIITIKDSNWMMSFAMHRQPHFKEQNDQQSITSIWIETRKLYQNQSNNVQPRNYARVTLSFRGPEGEIERISEESATTIPVYMPFITSFMLREPGDRPLVVPNGSKILLSLGTSQILNEIRCLQQSILYGQRWKLFINC